MKESFNSAKLLAGSLFLKHSHSREGYNYQINGFWLFDTGTLFLLSQDKVIVDQLKSISQCICQRYALVIYPEGIY